AMEEPGYNEVALRLSEAGFAMTSIPVLPYPTWDDAASYLKGVDIAFATPVSQFPSNATMPIEIRRKLVAWADETQAYIIDDEYCWEFETSNPRLPALAALDTEDRVITLGTFSNSFTPSICLSYAVLPAALMLKWKQRKRSLHPSVPWQTQAAMAEFMRSGQWLAHIRRTRTAVQQKRERLMRAIRNNLGKDFEIIESTSSLFALARARDGRSEQELIDAALASSVRVYPTSPYWHAEPPADWRYVLIGFAGIPSFKIESGIKELAKAWKR
ncbi:MAG: PLP-dependent aminotransferase family protein, partial [Eggerthellaceae bacterium]|nr:PLP-dependent aminotransferase family protein [Eggerthellaceae bacterium]